MMFKSSNGGQLREYLLIGLKPDLIGMRFHHTISDRLEQWCGYSSLDKPQKTYEVPLKYQNYQKYGKV